MLAASFDLIQEGQEHGAGNWVVTGILAGGIFIWLCKKVIMIFPFSVSLPFLLMHNRLYLLGVLFFCSCASNLCTDTCLFSSMLSIIDMNKVHIHCVFLKEKN